MVGVIKKNSVVIIKDSTCFLKGEIMLSLVDFVFIFIPYKACLHAYIVLTF